MLLSIGKCLEFFARDAKFLNQTCRWQYLPPTAAAVAAAAAAAAAFLAWFGLTPSSCNACTVHSSELTWTNSPTWQLNAHKKCHKGQKSELSITVHEHRPHCHTLAINVCNLERAMSPGPKTSLTPLRLPLVQR